MQNTNLFPLRCRGWLLCAGRVAAPAVYRGDFRDSAMARGGRGRGRRGRAKRSAPHCTPPSSPGGWLWPLGWRLLCSATWSGAPYMSPVSRCRTRLHPRRRIPPQPTSTAHPSSASFLKNTMLSVLCFALVVRTAVASPGPQAPPPGVKVLYDFSNPDAKSFWRVCCAKPNSNGRTCCCFRFAGSLTACLTSRPCLPLQPR